MGNRFNGSSNGGGAPDNRTGPMAELAYVADLGEQLADICTQHGMTDLAAVFSLASREARTRAASQVR